MTTSPQIEALLARTNAFDFKVQRRPRVDGSDARADIKGMESKLAAMEIEIKHLNKAVDKLADVPRQLGILETKVADLPTKAHIDLRLIFMLTAIAMLVAFAGKIQALVS